MPRNATLTSSVEAYTHGVLDYGLHFDYMKKTLDDDRRLFMNLTARNPGSVPLGKLYEWSEVYFKLEPGYGTLPSDDDSRSPLPYSIEASQAINYPEAHPSEFQDVRATIMSSKDTMLRRSTSLG